MSGTPLRPDPVFVAKPWGGRFLAGLYGAAAPGTGEAWLASDLPGEKGTTVRGAPLARLIRSSIPLVKILDSTEALSVQLHPDDALARELHGPGYRGKWETWYFLRAPAEGFVYHGLAAGVAPADLLAALGSGRSPEPLLRRVHVRAGDSLAVPPGTVHALTAGAVVIEVQTPADLTYRLHDWGRVGADGRSRELHLGYGEAALALAPPPTDPREPAAVPGTPGRYRLAATGPLGFELLRGAEGPLRIPGDVSAHALVFVGLEGGLELRSVAGAWEPEELAPGDCVLVPAGSGELMVGGGGVAALGYFTE